MAREKIDAAIAALNITMTTVFVPFSQSRNKDGKHRTLNWRVAILRNGREVLTTDYSAGVGHCSERTRGERDRYHRALMEQFETEHGKAARMMHAMTHVIGSEPLVPNIYDVISSLVLDSSVLDSGGFNDWAADFGYDPDSRAAESTYRECLELALKMRSAFADAGMATLREACRDY